MSFPLIDILRAVAALLVLAYHVIQLGQWRGFAQLWVERILSHGWVGVDLFLVISGFVITLSAARDFERNPQCYRWCFMRRRLRRLVPLYLLTCTAYLFLVRPDILINTFPVLVIQVLSHALFLQNLHPLTHGVINGVSWSLALEMQFYVALILSIGWLLRMGPWRTLFLLVGVSWAWRFATTIFLAPGAADVHLQVIYTTELPGTLDAFGMGITLALLVHKGHGAWADRLRTGWQNCLMWLALAAAALWSASAIFFQHPQYWADFGMVVFWRTLLATGFAAALAAVVTCPLRGGGVLRPIRYLGHISYGIYLWHFPVLLALLTLPNVRGLSLFWSVLMGAGALASLSWHLMERHWVVTSKSPRSAYSESQTGA